MNRAVGFIHEIADTNKTMERDYAKVLKRNIDSLDAAYKELKGEVGAVMWYLNSAKTDAPSYDTLVSEARSAYIEVSNILDTLKKTLVDLSNED